MDIWKIAYHLCGITLLGRSGNHELEPLASLPMPVRNAVLRLAKMLQPEAVEIEEVVTPLEYTSGTYCWIANWYITNKQLLDHVLDPVPALQVEFQSMEEYFVAYDLNPPVNNFSHDDNNLDEHYAERLFIREIIMPTWGTAALQYIVPQVPFGYKGQRIDFVIKGDKSYAIEIEGYKWHKIDNQAKFRSEKRRVQDLAEYGYTYYPIPFDDIKNGNATQKLLRLLQTDCITAQLVEHLTTDNDAQSVFAADDVKRLLRRFVDRYQQYQALVLAILYESVTTAKAQIMIGDFCPRYPLFAIALHDTLLLLAQVSRLYDLPLDLPTIEFYTVGAVSEHYQTLFDLYLQAGPEIEGELLSASVHKISYHAVVDNPDLPFTYYSQGERHRHIQINSAYLFAHIEKYVTAFCAHIGNQLPTEATIAVTDRAVLDYFARRYFRIPELKHEQLLLLQRALQDQSTIGILPTGFGKSLTFQLYAVLVPRTTLVISPLKALMRDQLYNLHRLGFNCVGAITSDDKTADKDAKLKSFLNHEYRLLYLSPERLQIKSFQKEVINFTAQVPIGALVIDEAHCVSEWGHDFRPAYLQLAHYRQRMERILQRKVVTFGLTATASPVVEKDIIALLQLHEDAVVRLSTADRPNLSFSVHPIADRELAKLQMLETVVKQFLPQALKLDSWQALIPVGQSAPFPHAGVVFSIYADPHGRTTIEEGVPAIAARVVETLALDASLVQVHASKPTTRCPKCRSVFYLRTRKGKLGAEYICSKCQNTFSQKQVYVTPGWNQQIIERQNAFQANQFPLLVATKGFGMGIDKRNIRYVIHHALAGGMEGYFQEAGRAGRDGKHAHIVLIYQPPTQSCYADHLSKNQPPPCVTNPKDFKFHQCSYGLSHLCDAGRQSRFIAQNYPGQACDKQSILATYRDLIARKGIIDCKNTFDDEEDESKLLQIQLYRLQQLGIVKNYMLDYSKFSQIRFEVDVQPYQLNVVTENLARYLAKLNSSKQAIDAALTKLRASDKLEVAIDILLERIYAEIPKMRYTMLGNLLRYATNEKRNICRRVEIRSTFDGGDLPLADYRCGFCDVCQPDLDFQVEAAVVPLGDAKINDISRTLMQRLETFDILVLTQIVQIAVEKGAIPGLYAKVSRLLERNATKIAVLYLAGALALRQREFAALGLGQLHFCYQEAIRQGMPIDVLKFIYHEAKAENAVEAFRWISEVGGPFDQTEDFVFLTSEAGSIWGDPSPQLTNLNHIQRIRHIRSLQTDLVQLSSSLRTLTRRVVENKQFEGNG